MLVVPISKSLADLLYDLLGESKDTKRLGDESMGFQSGLLKKNILSFPSFLYFTETNSLRFIHLSREPISTTTEFFIFTIQILDFVFCSVWGYIIYFSYFLDISTINYILYLIGKILETFFDK